MTDLRHLRFTTRIVNPLRPARALHLAVHRKSVRRVRSGGGGAGVPRAPLAAGMVA